MLLSYLRLVLFAAGLLIGVQVPGFINDYAKRVEAHLIEAQTGLRGFQGPPSSSSRATCRRWWRITAPVTTRFSQRCRQPEHLLNRQLALDKQFQAMQGPWYIRFLQVVLAADRTFARKPGTATATRSC
jgi:hypothetical protein